VSPSFPPSADLVVDRRQVPLPGVHGQPLEVRVRRRVLGQEDREPLPPLARVAGPAGRH
jgi:hypothetical protein